MKRHQRMKTVAGMTKKITAKGRFDAKNSWWVSESLVAESWLHPKWEDCDGTTMVEEGEGTPGAG